MADEVTVRLKGEFALSYLKPGEHTFIVPFNDESAKKIGEIVMCWGALEVRMDALTEHIMAGMNKLPAKRWRTRSFRDRRDLFKKTMREYTAQMFPHETATFDRIADASLELQWQRNVVVHGYYENATRTSD